MDYSTQGSSSTEFSRQGYWSGHFLLQGILPDPGIEPGSPTLQADSFLSEPLGKRREYQRGSPSPPLGDLPDPGIEPMTPAWQADSSLLKRRESPGPQA